MAIEGLGAFHKYDRLKLDGRISLQEFRRQKRNFVADFVNALTSKKLSVLSRMTEAARAELLQELKKLPLSSSVQATKIWQSTKTAGGAYLTGAEAADWLAGKVTAAIEFALRTGSADEIGPRDFFHAHIVIPVSELIYFHVAGPREQLLADLKEHPPILLYHTQEYTGKFGRPDNYHRRNLVQIPSRDAVYYTERSRYSPPLPALTRAFPGEPPSPPRFHAAVYPSDLNARQMGMIYFELDPDGKYTFRAKGQVFRYNIYLSLDSGT